MWHFWERLAPETILHVSEVFLGLKTASRKYRNGSDSSRLMDAPLNMSNWCEEDVRAVETWSLKEPVSGSECVSIFIV